jgi:hypothetical protein
MTADGNELSFETERSSTDEELAFEDDFSAAGSQYANLTENEGCMDYPNADFQGDGRQEALFGC